MLGGPLEDADLEKAREILLQGNKACGSPVLLFQRILGFEDADLSELIHAVLSSGCDFEALLAAYFHNISEMDRESGQESKGQGPMMGSSMTGEQVDLAQNSVTQTSTLPGPSGLSSSASTSRIQMDPRGVLVSAETKVGHGHVPWQDNPAYNRPTFRPMLHQQSRPMVRDGHTAGDRWRVKPEFHRVSASTRVLPQTSHMYLMNSPSGYATVAVPDEGTPHRRISDPHVAFWSQPMAVGYLGGVPPQQLMAGGPPSYLQPVSMAALGPGVYPVVQVPPGVRRSSADGAAPLAVVPGELVPAVSQVSTTTYFLS